MLVTQERQWRRQQKMDISIFEGLHHIPIFLEKLLLYKFNCVILIGFKFHGPCIHFCPMIHGWPFMLSYSVIRVGFSVSFYGHFQSLELEDQKPYFFLVRVLFIYLFIFYFTILYWFCHTSTWIHHRYTRVPHPEPLSLLSLRTIPLGHFSAPAPSIQYHALNLDWRFISYMILYMFQCHSPKSSHPLPLPQSPVCGTAKETQRPYFDGQRVERWWSRKS